MYTIDTCDKWKEKDVDRETWIETTAGTMQQYIKRARKKHNPAAINKENIFYFEYQINT